MGTAMERADVTLDNTGTLAAFRAGVAEVLGVDPADVTAAVEGEP
jgi:hypothetical protein